MKSKHLVSHSLVSRVLVAVVLPALATIGSLAQTGPGCVMVPTNFVGWWPGDNHGFNVMNQRAAIAQGVVAYAPGIVGDAFQFTGAGKMRVLEATSIDLSRTNRWSLTAWVKPATLDGAASPTLYSEGNKVASLGLQRGTGKLESWINGAHVLTSTVTLPATEWSHVALVLDRATRTLYVNGVAAGSVSGTPATTPDSSGAAIGGTTVDDPNAAFAGEMDELTLHRRVLTAEEIAAIATADGSGLCFGDGTPAWVVEPQPIGVPLFGNVTFLGLAMASPRPSYQWYFEQEPLVGQTQPTLERTNLTMAHDGIYRLVATSGAQTIQTEARLTVQFCSEAPTGLVAWWPADGNGIEFTGLHSGAVWNDVRFPEGMAGRAFQFDGTSAYVAVPDSAALSPHAGADGGMTLEAWVYLPAWPSQDPATKQDRRVVLAKGDPGRWEYSLSITTTGVPEFFAYNPAGDGFAGVAGGQLLLNQWHHLVATLKKGDSLRLYQDGQLMAENTTFTVDTRDTGSPLYLGRRGDAQFLNGSVDEPALYSRALTIEEVAGLYASGSVGKCYGGGPKPVFVSEPRDVSGYLLNSATLEGMALGTPRPEYQWYHGDLPMEGATNSALSLTELTEAEAGEYTLVASNAFGATRSRTANLRLTDYVSVPEDFEDGWAGWTADDYSVWQVGEPASGPGTAHSGNQCAATVLDGKYPANANTRLISPAFVVPAVGAEPRLRFWHWMESEGSADVGAVEIREVGSGSWVELGRYSGASLAGWARPSLALGAFAGKTVELALHFWSNGRLYEYSGWYVDDLEIETGVRTIPVPQGVEGFESGWADWYADYGVWQVGEPASGPGTAHSGNQCAATVLDGKYPANANTRLISPAFVVPAVGAEPRLRFWHWMESEGSADVGAVEIREVGSGDWVELGRYSGASLAGWARPSLALGAFAGKTVELALHFWSNGRLYEYSGWYVDDLEIETGVRTIPVPQGVEGFESGWADWYAEYGVWQVGEPAGGPGTAHSGNQCAATVLDGKYPANANTRLISPAFVVPAAGAEPRLRFWHWMESEGSADVGAVEIREVGSGDWVELGRYSGASLAGWARPSLALGAFAGKTVELALRFWSNGRLYEYSGWYVDDLEIETGVRTIPVPQGVEGFESGWADWYADYGVWQVGEPASGPGTAHSGKLCAATVLDGKYPANANTRLISPAFVVPAVGAEPRLRFWHWMESEASADVGAVEIREVGSGDWVELGRYSGASLAGWVRPSLALGAFAGRTVELALHFWSNGRLYEYSGWYVDDLMIQVGNIGLAEVPDRTVDEKTPVDVQINAVGGNAHSVLSFTLPWAPEGAWVDPETGLFFWLPGERHGPGVFDIPVQVVDYGNGEANEMTTVRITVNEVNERPWLWPAALAVEPGQRLHFPLFAGDRDLPGNPLRFTMAGAPAGATLSPNTGVLDWVVPANAPGGTYPIQVTLSDNASPPYTTNNTVTLTVTANATHGLSVRPLGGADFEFTIHDVSVAEDYVLQRATDVVDSVRWIFNGGDVPAWVATLPAERYMDWSTWDEFVQQRLQRTTWEDVVRVTPTAMPHVFIHPIADLGSERVSVFRSVRVPR